MDKNSTRSPRFIDANLVFPWYVEAFPEFSPQDVRFSMLDILSNLDNIPAADVRPVVRCKDCVHAVKGKKSLECKKHRYAQLRYPLVAATRAAAGGFSMSILFEFAVLFLLVHNGYCLEKILEEMKK